MTFPKNKLLIIFILFLTAYAFLPSLKNDFVNWDDPLYIINNENIHDLSIKSIIKSFTSLINGVYAPVTELSLAIDYRFSHLNPFGYHLTNLLFHLANTFLVYLFIFKLTKKEILAFIVMILFGVHPMRVESVAWITERKDVLYGFFYLLSLINYLNYIDTEETSNKKQNLLSTYFFFLLALLSKPAAVPLPIVLIMVDWWRGRKFSKSIVLEKLPFFGIAFIFGLITMIGCSITSTNNIQFPANTFQSLSMNPIEYYPQPCFWYDKIALCSYSLVLYIVRLFWFTDLSAFYPFPQKINNYLPFIYYLSIIIWPIFGAVILLTYKKNKMWLFGILFFLSMIILTLPFKPIGNLSLIGERFTYIPYIGLFLIIATYIEKYFFNSKIPKKLQLTISALIISFFIIQTRAECRVWKNGISLWENISKLYPHEISYLNLAEAYTSEHNHLAIINVYTKALQINPIKKYHCYINRAAAYSKINEYEKARKDYEQAIQLEPNAIDAYINRVILYLNMEKREQALQEYQHLQTIATSDPRLEMLKKYLEKDGILK